MLPGSNHLVHLVLYLLDLDGGDGGELELADDGEGRGRLVLLQGCVLLLQGRVSLPERFVLLLEPVITPYDCQN